MGQKFCDSLAGWSSLRVSWGSSPDVGWVTGALAGAAGSTCRMDRSQGCWQEASALCQVDLSAESLKGALTRRALAATRTRDQREQEGATELTGSSQPLSSDGAHKLITKIMQHTKKKFICPISHTHKNTGIVGVFFIHSCQAAIVMLAVIIFLFDNRRENIACLKNSCDTLVENHCATLPLPPHFIRFSSRSPAPTQWAGNTALPLEKKSVKESVPLFSDHLTFYFLTTPFKNKKRYIRYRSPQIHCIHLKYLGINALFIFFFQNQLPLVFGVHIP